MSLKLCLPEGTRAVVLDCAAVRPLVSNSVFLCLLYFILIQPPQTRPGQNLVCKQPPYPLYIQF